jgi:class 3 adenylate cyclase
MVLPPGRRHNQRMEPEVRYCTTTDGMRIAYAATGSGAPIVNLRDPPSSHVKLSWSHPLIGVQQRELARENTLVQLDLRGCGLSDRDVPQTLDDYVMCMEAVVERLQLDTLCIHASGSACATAIVYAARYPQRVRRMAFLDGYARLGDVLATPPLQALVAAAAVDWDMATEAIGAMTYGPGREESRTQGAYVRECVDRDTFIKGTESVRTFDATPYLQQLTMPVLVLRHTGIRFVTDEMTRELVSRIPDARLVTVEGLYADDPMSVTRRVVDFLNESTSAPAVPTSAMPAASGVRTVLFTDLVGHTEMMQRLGDVRGRDLLREHERITRDALSAHGGTEVKTDGDSFMASFSSVSSAVGCAVALQRAFALHSATGGEPIVVRMGLNVGEPIEEDGDYFGSAVILGARIKDQAKGGEILVPEAVRHMLSGKGFLFADRGEFALKGFEDAVRVYEVRWRE